MKTLIDSYTFSPSTKQITLNEPTQIKIEQILLITNITDNTIIYNFADNSLGGTISSNVLTLNYNTVSMSNTDSLQIFIDTPNVDFIALNDLLADGLSEIVHQLQSIRNDGGMADVAGRVRCNIETGTVNVGTATTVTGVTTVSTVSNIASAGGIGLQTSIMSMTNQGWGNIRNKITVT